MMIFGIVILIQNIYQNKSLQFSLLNPVLILMNGQNLRAELKDKIIDISFE